METINGNPMSDLIYLFLDGETDSTQQAVLFKSLAENPELQTEFQEAVSLNKSLVTDSKSLTPSDELTQNLFVKAGFESGAGNSGGAGLVAEHARNTFISGLIGKIKTSIIPASIGSIITAALLTTGMYLLNIDFHSQRHAAVSNEGIQRQVVTKNENQIPVVKSEAVQSENRTHHSSNIFRRKPINLFTDDTQSTSIERTEKVTDSNVESTEDIPVVVVPDIKTSELAMSNINPELNYRNNDFTQLNVPNKSGFGDLSVPTNLGFLVEVKGINNLYYTDKRNMDESKVLFKNIGVNILYKISDNLLIGCGFGNEQMQIYEVVKDRLNNIGFLSEPNLTWYSINTRYLLDLNNLIGNIKPYGDFAFGATKWGLVFKGGAGFFYNPENSFTMGLGLEGTELWLANALDKNKRFTQKIALVYTFGYNF